MKKLLSLLISVLLILQIVPALATTEAEPRITDKYDYNLLQTLGIFDGASVSYDTVEISRGQFAVCVFNLFKYENRGVSNGSQFIDLGETHFATKAVNTLYNMGMVSGKSAEFFAPDETITLNEAAKLLVAGLGYSKHAVENGGYPVGYGFTADKLKIMPQGSVNDALTCDQLVYMFMKSLVVTPLTERLVGDSYKIYDGLEGETLGKINFDLYKSKGFVKDVTPAPANKDAKDTVLVGNTAFETDSVEIFDVIGRYIDFWYVQENENDRARIISAKPDADSDVLSIDADDLVSFSANVYKYNEGSKVRTITIDSSAQIFYNGKSVRYFKDLMMPLHGSVVLAKKADETNYTSVVISSYVNGCVQMVDKDNLVFALEDGVIYKKIENGVLKNANTSMVDAEKDGFYLRLYNKDGEKKSIKSLLENSIISMYFDPYGNGVTAYYSLSTVSGTVESTSGTDDYVFVDGQEYRVLYELITKRDITVGMNGVFALDYKGNIVDVSDSKNTNSNMAFFVKGHYEDGISKKMHLVLVDIDKRAEVICEMKPEIKFNNVKKTIKTKAQFEEFIKEFRHVFHAATDKEFASLKFVIYKTDSNGIITELDTIGSPKYPDIRMVRTFELDSENNVDKDYRKFLSNTTLNTIGDKILYTDSSAFIDLPYAKVNDDVKGVYNEEFLKKSGSVVKFMGENVMANQGQIGGYFEFYYLDDPDIASLVVKHGTELIEEVSDDVYMPIGSYTGLGMFIEHGKSLEGEDDYCDRVKFMDANGEIQDYSVLYRYSTMCDSEFSLLRQDLKQGDIFAYYVQDGRIGNFLKVYDYDTSAQPYASLIGAPVAYANMTADGTRFYAPDALTATSGKYNTPYRLTVGRAFELKKSMLKVALGDTTDDSNIGYFNIDTNRIITFDSEARNDNNVRKGTVSDLKLLEYYPGDVATASEVVVFMQNGRTITLFVYN